MPKTSLPIGTCIECDKWGKCIILGRKPAGHMVYLETYHLYSFDHCAYIYQNIQTLRYPKSVTPESSTLAQDLLLQITNLPETPNSELKLGTTIISHTPGVPDLEYIILTNGHKRVDGTWFLTATHIIGKNNWCIDYCNEFGRVFQTYAKNPPTNESIKKARALLFEYLIAPAFTT